MTKKTSTGARNRINGHNYERKLAKEFRELGYDFCKTSREASRTLDNCKIDLAFLPMHVQAKSVKSAINYGDIFRAMKEKLKENFPKGDPEHGKVPFIFHKRGRKDGDEVVVMKKADFYDIIKQIYPNECD